MSHDNTGRNAEETRQGKDVLKCIMPLRTCELSVLDGLLFLLSQLKIRQSVLSRTRQRGADFLRSEIV
ncbi:unnamed protein product [Cylicocyclus nassatus]|uniref:Uncharacterized protein n=1 Tax=Cylicocyclus nassatus TaxID=53992 RepID=A0AA36GUZ0_CYLNA|nr:unnamed protein product [Cylicocyclus nassatus]